MKLNSCGADRAGPEKPRKHLPKIFTHRCVFCRCTVLDHAGTKAVLTGGSAAIYYSPHRYQSLDADFVIVMSLNTDSALTITPNQLWSWDITKLRGPVPWTYFYLYVILDVFSRYVVGWMVAHRESASLAKRLIAESCIAQGVTRDQLTLHADRASSMTSKAIAQLLADPWCRQIA